MKRNYLNLVSVREKCLNHSRPNGVSVLGINKAIYKEHLNTGDCGRIGSHLLILYAHLLLISSMILRVGTTPKSSASMVRSSIASNRNSRFLCVSPHLKHNLSAVEKYLRKSYSNLSPIQKEKR